MVFLSDNYRRYNGTRAYAQSKLANILHAKEIAKQLKVGMRNKITLNFIVILFSSLVRGFTNQCHKDTN